MTDAKETNNPEPIDEVEEENDEGEEEEKSVHMQSKDSTEGKKSQSLKRGGTSKGSVVPYVLIEGPEPS